MSDRPDAPCPETAAPSAPAGEAAPREPVTGAVRLIGQAPPADLPAAHARIALLEQAIAAERARTLARAREVESGVRVLRGALQDLQAERQRMRVELDRLGEELSRAQGAAAQVAAAPPDTTSDDARAASARLAERVSALEAEAAEREAALGQARSRVAELEATRAAVPRPREPRPDGPVARPRPPLDSDTPLPALIGAAVAKRPWVAAAALSVVAAAFGFWHVLDAAERPAAERYRVASAVAERMVEDGDLDGARAVYRRFLRDTGDARVEREAARRYDELGARR